MFNRVITSTPLTTPAANNYFTKIPLNLGYMVSGTGQYDHSFVATLRALVAPRMGEDDLLSVCFYERIVTASTIQGRGMDVMCSDILSSLRSLTDENRITICNFKGNDIDATACLTLMEQCFEEQREGFHRLSKVTEFFHKTFGVLCFINPDSRTVAIFGAKLDVKKMHYLQCAILAFLPWYFDPAKGITQEERDLIQSLRERTPDKYLQCLAKIAEKYDFRTDYIRSVLTGFENRNAIKEKNNIENRNANLNRQIEDCYATISMYMAEQRNNNRLLMGILAQLNADDGTSELADYFMTNKRLSLVDSNDDEITFVVKDYLAFWDEDCAERVIDNAHSVIYYPRGRGCNAIIPRDDMKRLMKAIFLDRTIKVKICAAFTLNTELMSVVGRSGWTYGFECDDCMPNPHLDEYSCLGDYRRFINAALQDNNNIGAIEQCCASAKSLNFGDSTVLGCFASRLYGLANYTHNKCLELPDGRVVGAIEAAKWLKEQQEENANEQTN